MFGLNKYIIIGVAILVAIFGLYFMYSQHQIKELSKTIALQEVSIQQQKLIIAQQEKDVADIKKTNQILADLHEKDSEQRKKLENTLSKLQNVASKKSKLLEDLINKASVNRATIQLATGAEPLPNEINRVCPQLLPKKGK